MVARQGGTSGAAGKSPVPKGTVVGGGGGDFKALDLKDLEAALPPAHTPGASLCLRAPAFAPLAAAPGCSESVKPIPAASHRPPP